MHVSIGTIYIGSSLLNAERVKELQHKFRDLGVDCTYDWTAHGQVFTAHELTAFGMAEELGISKADVFLFVFPGRSGTHYEMGYARGLGKPIVLLGEDETVEQKTFYHLPGLYKTRSEETAILTVLDILGRKNVSISPA